MSLPTEETLRLTLAAAARALHARGWAANHDGNATARLGDGRLLCTPTAMSKAEVQPETLLVLDADGAVLSGSRRPMGELHLHRAAYAARPDIGVVLHSHPPHLCAFACAGIALPHPFLAEAVVSLGAEVPWVPAAAPGDPALDAGLQAALQKADVVVLGGHGLLTVGGSPEQALLRMELVEHLARIAWLALPMGGVKPLAEALVASLSAKGRPASVPSFGEAPTAGASKPADPWRAAELPAARPDPRQVVVDALRRFGG